MADADADLYCPHWGMIDPETAKQIQLAGKLIGVWPVDDPVALAWSSGLPANAIFTNKPRTIRPVT
jgi:hypothetical protein